MGNIDLAAVLQVVTTAERVLMGSQVNGRAGRAAQNAFDTLSQAARSAQH
jgi:hypothetical protein